MQPASMGWTSNRVRVGTSGEGDTTRVVAQRSTSKWITIDDSGVALQVDEALLFSGAVRGPRDLEAACRGGGKQGAHSAGWMSAHTAPGEWRSLTASWT